MQKNNDEIDLRELALRLRNSLKNNRNMIIGLIIMTMLISIVYVFIRPPEYENHMVVRSAILNEDLLEVLATNLNQLIEEDNSAAMAKKTDRPEEACELLTHIEINLLEERSQTKDDKDLEPYYLITIKALQNENWASYEQGMLHYLTHNGFANKRVALRRERYTKMMAKLDREIEQLDSLKKDIVGMKMGKEELLVLNPTAVYTSLVQLYKERLSYGEQLELNEAIEVIDGMNVSGKLANPGLVLMLVIGLISGCLISGVIVILVETDRYLKRYEKLKNT